MTLAPDHTGYHVRGEIDDPPVRVSVIPAREWTHLAQPPEDAPDYTNLALARDLIHAHLWDGVEQGDPWEITWAHIVTDLHNKDVIPLRDAEDYIANYHHWAALNGGPDWDPVDADELHTDTTKRLKAAGYTERTTP